MKMRAAIVPLVTCLVLAGGAVPRVRRQTQNCLGAVCQVTSLQVQDNSCGPAGCSSSSLGGVAAVAAVAAPPHSSAPHHLLRPGETRPLSCGGGARGVVTSCSAHSCGVTCGDGTQVRSSSFTHITS